jgi:hypothetical protein
MQRLGIPLFEKKNLYSKIIGLPDGFYPNNPNVGANEGIRVGYTRAYKKN